MAAGFPSVAALPSARFSFSDSFAFRPGLCFHPPAMVPSLEIFRIESGALRWCEAVGNMETAKSRIKKLALSSRGHYFIFDQKSGQRIDVSVKSGHRGPRVDMG
jgi:hypothetical protein